ncbi:MAG: ABC transporter ATP-binding protein [Spirochaetes bacterium]|nr:ABC transporter ATP-binding protein [Spirochaetota bacterium]
MNKELITIKNLKVYYPKYKGVLRKVACYIKAVDDVSFGIHQKSTLGLVGESGCGKTTVGKTILSLIPATSGHIFFKDKDITHIQEEERKELARKIQIIFQDPYGSLNPKMMIGKIIDEAINIRYPNLSGEETSHKTCQILNKVGLYEDDYGKYPHEFSGGQRQRIGIARAIAVEPEFIVCDESVSSLDVSIQADILNLLKDLQTEKNLTYLFIAHDLSVVKYISSYIAVMYLGHIMEYGSRDVIFRKALHPYTISLLSAIPKPDPSKKTQRIILKGDVPSPIHKPSGCPFHTRCYMKKPECDRIIIQLKERDKGHWTACPFN